MAKKYTATINVNCWKEHTCTCCGAVYAYPFARTIKGTAGSAEGAQRAAQKNVAKTLQRDTDMHPCPTCGLYQSDMIGQRLAAWRNIVFWCALIVLAIVLIIPAAHGLQMNVVSQVLAVICGIVAVVEIGLELYNPNKNPQGNLQISQQTIAAGRIRFNPGRPNARADDFSSMPRGPLHLLAFGAVLLAMVPAYLPEVIRQSRHWPLNAESYPPIVGPGDVARFYMPDSIQSLKGYWDGRPTAVLSTGDLSLPNLACSTNQNSWGGTIYVKESEKSTSSHPWVDVNFPDNPKIENKPVSIAIMLELSYPEARGSAGYVTVNRTMQRTVEVNLGPAGSGTQYTTMWWSSSWAAVAASCAGSLGLFLAAKAHRSRANPTRTYA